MQLKSNQADLCDFSTMHFKYVYETTGVFMQKSIAKDLSFKLDNSSQFFCYENSYAS